MKAALTLIFGLLFVTLFSAGSTNAPAPCLPEYNCDGGCYYPSGSQSQGICRKGPRVNSQEECGRNPNHPDAPENPYGEYANSPRPPSRYIWCPSVNSPTPNPTMSPQFSALISIIQQWNGMMPSGKKPFPDTIRGLLSNKFITMSCDDCQLTGPIPAELGLLVNLKVLTLSNSQLTGPIPSELGKLAKLTKLNLSGNELTGPIPAELGQLADLTGLQLQSNQLTGPIPAELGQLAKLRKLHLFENQLTGAEASQKALKMALPELSIVVDVDVDN